MSDELEISTLEKLAEIIDSRHKTPQYSNQGLPMVRVVDVTGGKLELSNTNKVSQEVYDDFSKGRNPEIGDLVISRVGSYGNVCYVSSKEKFCLGQNTALIVPKRVNWRYLYYQLISPNIKNQIESLVVGAVQKTISLKSIKSLELLSPSLSEQEAVAHILGSLDDKIELNRKMNQTLEAMAQALFKSWFVDFDPVIDNALAAGNEIPEELQARAVKRRNVIAGDVIGIPTSREKQSHSPLNPLLHTNPTLAAQFPDSFIFNETMGKWIPEGWEFKKLDKICKVKTGFPFKSQEYSFSEGIKVIRGENVSLGYLRWDTLKTWDKKTEHLNDYWLSEYDIVIGMDGSRVGRNRSFVYKHELPMLLAQRVAALSCKKEIGFAFLGQLILGNSFENYVENVKTGTSIPHISAKQIKEFKVLVPSNSLAREFSTLLKTNLDKQSKLTEENQSLSQLRDRLLPELISGKIRVKQE